MSKTSMKTAPPRAGRREWIGLAVLMLPTLLLAMDLTVLHLAVPALTEDIKPSSAELLWITDIYGFMIAGSLITMGTLGDRIGRRKLLLIGGTAFAAASVLAAFANTAALLIASRAVLGVAGATLMPSTMSLIRNMFLDPRQRTDAIGIWVSGFSVGSAIGPLVGGFLLQYFWWGSVFLLAVPVMAILLISGPLLLPEYKDPNPGKFDLPSAGLSLASILLMIYGLKQMAQNGFGWQPVLFIAAGLAVGFTFVQRQRALADPLIDLRLFQLPTFNAALAIYTLGIFASFGTFLFIAQYLQLVLGLTPLEAGMWSVPGALTFILGSNVAPRIVRFIRPATIVGGGLIVATIGMMMVAVIGQDSLWLIVVGNTLMSLGFGFTFTLAVDLVVAAAPPERAGAASAIAETGAEFGGALGLAILGSLGVAIYRLNLNASLPAGIPAEAVQAAQETLGGAMVAAAELPAQTGAALLDAARQAFVQALHINAYIGVVGFVLLVIITMTMLRDLKPHDEEANDQAMQDMGGQALPDAIGD